MCAASSKVCDSRRAERKSSRPKRTNRTSTAAANQTRGRADKVPEQVGDEVMRRLSKRAMLAPGKARPAPRTARLAATGDAPGERSMELRQKNTEHSGRSPEPGRSLGFF